MALHVGALDRCPVPVAAEIIPRPLADETGRSLADKAALSKTPVYRPAAADDSALMTAAIATTHRCDFPHGKRETQIASVAAEPVEILGPLVFIGILPHNCSYPTYNMIGFIHQYAYLFSLVLFILPISILFDSRIGFKVARKLMTRQGVSYLVLSVAFWSTYDLFWISKLGHFPPDRILFTVGGVPFEEMLLFAVGLYNIGAIFTWAKGKFP